MCQTKGHKLDFWEPLEVFYVLDYRPADMERHFKFNKPFWRTPPWTFCFHHENWGSLCEVIENCGEI